MDRNVKGSDILKLWSGWTDRQVQLLKQHAPKFLDGCSIIEVRAGELPSLLYQEGVYKMVERQKGKLFWSDSGAVWGITVEEIGFLYGRKIFGKVMEELELREAMKRMNWN